MAFRVPISPDASTLKLKTFGLVAISHPRSALHRLTDFAALVALQMVVRDASNYKSALTWLIEAVELGKSR
ncbi:unnamed protein product [Heligmosomoides polygyrus]|uniref:TPR_REGION domain-containing protein n=1 Tax=Heligmosomoides polygyrus TaxID=6339 RepID=A0A183GUR6_HELPZ|nr:unnamed protein product [Heligmosomoides polygyrus]